MCSWGGEVRVWKKWYVFWSFRIDIKFRWCRMLFSSLVGRVSRWSGGFLWLFLLVDDVWLFGGWGVEFGLGWMVMRWVIWVCLFLGFLVCCFFLLVRDVSECWIVVMMDEKGVLVLGFILDVVVVVILFWVSVSVFWCF